MLYRHLTARLQRMAARSAGVGAYAAVRAANRCDLASVMVRVGEDSANFPDASSIALVRRVNSAWKAATQNKNSNSQDWAATCARANGMTSRRKMIVFARQCWSSASGTAVLRPASTTLWAESSISRTMSGTLPEFGPKTDWLHNLPRGCRDLPAHARSPPRLAHSTQLLPVHGDGAT